MGTMCFNILIYGFVKPFYKGVMSYPHIYIASLLLSSMIINIRLLNNTINMNLPKMILKEMLSRNNTSDDYYYYIQLRSNIIVKHFTIALKEFEKRNPKKDYLKILDVGSGLGGALSTMRGAFEVLAKENLGADFNGLEVDELLVEIANKQRLKTFVGDALTYKDYKHYDIIYYYHPISTRKLQVKLEKRIERMAKKGCIVIAMMKEGERKYENESYTLAKNWKVIDREDDYLVMRKIK